MSVAAALLMGGRSTRMGVDKTYLEIEGQPLWWRQWRKLRALPVDRLFLSARAEQAIPTPQGEGEIIRDAYEEIGPLGGILSCLRELEMGGPGGRVVVLGIDLPLLPIEFLQDLAFTSEPGRGAVLRRADRYEPLAAVYPVEMLESGRRRVRAGQYSLQAFIEEGVQQSLMLEMPEKEWPEEIFTNLNAPADVAALNP